MLLYEHKPYIIHYILCAFEILVINCISLFMLICNDADKKFSVCFLPISTINSQIHHNELSQRIVTTYCHSVWSY